MKTHVEHKMYTSRHVKTKRRMSGGRRGYPNIVINHQESVDTLCDNIPHKKNSIESTGMRDPGKKSTIFRNSPTNWNHQEESGDEALSTRGSAGMSNQTMMWTKPPLRPQWEPNCRSRRSAGSHWSGRLCHMGLCTSLMIIFRQYQRKEVINRIGFVLGRSYRICLLKPSNTLGNNYDASAPEYWKKAVRDPLDPL